MKKIAIFIINPIRSPYKIDQYDSFRAEGRILMNVGFGLSLLGFEINIIFNEWEINENKQICENIYLSNHPMYDNYDYILMFSPNYLDFVKCDKTIFLDYAFRHIEEVHQYVENTKKDVTYINIAEHVNKKAERDGHKFPMEYSYMPALYPIPSINVGFLPYSFEITNNELNFFIYYNSLKATTQYALKYKFVIDFFKNKGYKIKLYIHTGSKETLVIFPFDDKNYDINYIYDTDARYIDILNNIKSSDICMIPGSHCSGNDIGDVISLGKPLLYISNAIINPEIDTHCNHIYDNPEYLIYIHESNEETIEKLEKFILNPEESYNAFKESHKDYDFNNWKEYAKKIFIP